MVEALAPPCEKWGANKSATNLREELIIRVQRKKKKRCLSVNQEEGFILSLGRGVGGGIG
jgi:hypothetical protein